MLHLFHILLCGVIDLGAAVRLLALEVIGHLSGLSVISFSWGSTLPSPSFNTLGDSSTFSWSVTEVLSPQPAGGLIDPSMEHMYPVFTPPSYSSALAVATLDTDILDFTHLLQVVIYAAVLVTISALVIMDSSSQRGDSMLRFLAYSMLGLLTLAIVPFELSPIWLFVPVAVSHSTTIITAFRTGLPSFSGLRASSTRLALDLIWVVYISEPIHGAWRQVHAWLPEGHPIVV
jgi:hypothetical protein